MADPRIQGYLKARDIALARGDRGLYGEAQFQLQRLGYVDPPVVTDPPAVDAEESHVTQEDAPEAPKRRGRPAKETTVVQLPERAVEE